METCARLLPPDRDTLAHPWQPDRDSLLLSSNKVHISHEKEEDTIGCKAPNLTSFVGSVVAKEIILTVGSLLELARIPSLYFRREYKSGLPSKAASRLYACLLDIGDLFESVPDILKMRTCLKIASKVIYAARVDFLGEDPSGKIGRGFREKTQMKIEKWKEIQFIPVSNPKHGKKRKNNKWSEAMLKKGAHVVLKMMYAEDFSFLYSLSLNGLDGSQEDIGETYSTAGLWECQNRQATHSDSLASDFDGLALANNEFYVCHKDKDGDRGMETSSLNFDDLDSVSKLQNTRRFIDIMQKVEDALQKGSDTLNPEVFFEDSILSRLVGDCNALALDIENEIVVVHYFLCEKYCPRFPELESLVIDPIYYAQVVKRIGNEMDSALGDLESLLPPAIASTVSVTALTTRGKPLSEEDLKRAIAACDRLISLDLAKKKILDYFESRMGFVAPNLSAVVGNAIAAKLIWTAGGVLSLATEPCGFLFYGPKNLAGVSTPPLLDETELLGSTPNHLRKRVRSRLGSKVVEAARVDYLREDMTGKIGRTLREEICKKIADWKELPLTKQDSVALPPTEPARKSRSRAEDKPKKTDGTALSVVFNYPSLNRFELMHPAAYSRWLVPILYNKNNRV